jgi:hypothetical protein
MTVSFKEVKSLAMVYPEHGKREKNLKRLVSVRIGDCGICLEFKIVGKCPECTLKLCVDCVNIYTRESWLCPQCRRETLFDSDAWGSWDHYDIDTISEHSYGGVGRSFFNEHISNPWFDD